MRSQVLPSETAHVRLFCNRHMDQSWRDTKQFNYIEIDIYIIFIHIINVLKYSERLKGDSRTRMSYRPHFQYTVNHDAFVCRLPVVTMAVIH
jgi:hypothetical protein